MRTQILAFLTAALFLRAESSSAADENARQKAFRGLPPPGTVLTENTRSIGHGFREVARSQANPPSHFEGIGHFVFVYFKDEKLCQCGENEIAISPDGAHVIYTDDSNGNLMLFNAASRTRKELARKFVGYPKSAAWDLAARRVVVTLEKYEKGVGSVHTRGFALQRPNTTPRAP